MKQGDKCKVRMLRTGKVVEAVYGNPCIELRKSHVVWNGMMPIIAISHIFKTTKYGFHECRFIGNPGVRE